MKYHNRKTNVGGMVFDSIKEAKRFKELVLLERAGVIQRLQRQVKYELIPKCGKERACFYIADFVYIEDGKTIVEDVKGYRTQVYKLKKKLMNWKYDIQIREV